MFMTRGGLCPAFSHHHDRLRLGELDNLSDVHVCHIDTIQHVGEFTNQAQISRDASPDFKLVESPAGQDIWKVTNVMQTLDR